MLKNPSDFLVPPEVRGSFNPLTSGGTTFTPILNGAHYEKRETDYTVKWLFFFPVPPCAIPVLMKSGGEETGLFQAHSLLDSEAEGASSYLRGSGT